MGLTFKNRVIWVPGILKNIHLMMILPTPLGITKSSNFTSIPFITAYLTNHPVFFCHVFVFFFVHPFNLPQKMSFVNLLRFFVPRFLVVVSFVNFFKARYEQARARMARQLEEGTGTQPTETKRSPHMAPSEAPTGLMI